MNKENLKAIIKNRSYWEVNKRTGNYYLPNGENLSSYLIHLVETQLELDNLGIMKDETICFMDKKTFEEWDKYMLRPPFRKEDEITTYDEQQERIRRIVNEML